MTTLRYLLLLGFGLYCLKATLPNRHEKSFTNRGLRWMLSCFILFALYFFTSLYVFPKEGVGIIYGETYLPKRGQLLWYKFDYEGKTYCKLTEMPKSWNRSFDTLKRYKVTFSYIDPNISIIDLQDSIPQTTKLRCDAPKTGF